MRAANQSELFTEKRKNALTELVSFRVSKVQLAELVERAAMYDLGYNAYARAVTIEALARPVVLGDLHQAITDGQAESTKLRQDLAFAMQTLLMCAGKMPEAEAKAWVQENFKP